MFPLLRLPKDAILETIRVMDIGGIIVLSLVSERCKKHVISLEMEAESFGVSIRRKVNIDIRTSEISMYMDFPCTETVMAGQKKKLKTPDSFIVSLLGENPGDDIIDFGPWKWTIFEYEDWLEHLWAVFHYEKIDRLYFNVNSSLYDLDDIQKVFGKADGLYVKHTGCYDFNQSVFKKFSHIERVRFDMNVFPADSNYSPRILIQNNDQLSIVDSDETSPTMKLNDLLIINSKSIEIHDRNISSKDMNSFIKLWMKGSNPRMEYLQFEYHIEEVPQVDEITKGIQFTEVPRERRFKCCGQELLVAGGIDIWRQDGTRATIEFSEAGIWHSFEMFVWHDHCFVNQDDEMY